VSCSFLLLIECLLNFRPDQFVAICADLTLEFIHEGLVVHVQQFACWIDKFLPFSGIVANVQAVFVIRNTTVSCELLWLSLSYVQKTEIVFMNVVYVIVNSPSGNILRHKKCCYQHNYTVSRQNKNKLLQFNKTCQICLKFYTCELWHVFLNVNKIGTVPCLYKICNWKCTVPG